MIQHLTNVHTNINNTLTQILRISCTNSFCWRLYFVLSIIFAISIQLASGGIVYLGCYQDFRATRDLSFGPYEHENMTIFMCTNYCSDFDFKFIGLQNSTQCWCGNSQNYATLGDEMDCDFPCGGDYNTVCGGTYRNSVYFNDTSHANGIPQDSDEWTLLVSPGSINSATSPAGRASHLAVGYPGSMLVFGGFTYHYVQPLEPNTTNTDDLDPPGYNVTTEVATRFNDVWRFDLVSFEWELLHDGNNSAPAPRSGHAGVLVESGSLYVFGGETQTNQVNDLWKFDLATSSWTLVHNGTGDKVPSPRKEHAAVLVKDRMYIFGGAFQEGYLNDLWAWDIPSMKWLLIDNGKEDAPDPRSSHTLSVIGSSQLIVSLGRGTPAASHCYASRIFRDVWSYDINYKAWTLLSDGSAPWDLVNKRWATKQLPKRYSHSTISYDDNIIVFGGWHEYVGRNDTWVFSLETHSWGLLERYPYGPYNRSSHSVISVSSGMLIFGGETQFYKSFNDVWLWRHNYTHFPTNAGGGGATGKNMGISLVVLWGVVLLLVIIAYSRKKRKIIKQYSIDAQPIPDKEIFYIDKRKMKEQLKSTREMELVVMKSQPSHQKFDSATSNYFDMLPDELVLHMFNFLPGWDFGRVSQVCKRFHRLANDNLLWKELCEQHWRSLDNPDDLKNFYITKYNNFHRHKQEAKHLRLLAFVQTTFPYYLFLALLDAAVFLTGLKLDGYINWSYFVVFGPLWAVDAVLLAVTIFVMGCWISQSPILESALKKTFPSVTSRYSSLGIVTFLLACVLCPVLLAMKLEGVPYVSSLNWWIILLPLLYISAVLTVFPLTLIQQRGWVWSLFWCVALLLSYDSTLLLVIAKLEGSIGGDFCLVFLPWWISDVFALVCAVSCCIELRSARLGWCITIIYAGYMISVITFRSLLCVNLGVVCGDPVAYSYTLIFITLHIFLFLFGIPSVIFIRQRFQK